MLFYILNGAATVLYLHTREGPLTFGSLPVFGIIITVSPGGLTQAFLGT